MERFLRSALVLSPNVLQHWIPHFPNRLSPLYLFFNMSRNKWCFSRLIMGPRYSVPSSSQLWVVVFFCFIIRWRTLSARQESLLPHLSEQALDKPSEPTFNQTLNNQDSTIFFCQNFSNNWFRINIEHRWQQTTLT